MKELERLKTGINLIEYIKGYGYADFDRNKSSKACVVLRRQADNGKIAISRAYDGHWVYYDFRHEQGGTILDFVMRQTGCNLGHARKKLRKKPVTGIKSLSPTAPLPEVRPSTKNRQQASWEYAATSIIDSPHPYLQSRGLGLADIGDLFFNEVRIDRRKNLCFPYFDLNGVAGIERRNQNYKNYTRGGTKGLWRGKLVQECKKAVICESPIDALSYAKLRNTPDAKARYFATGGQISRTQWVLFDCLVRISTEQNLAIVLAFDNDEVGRNYCQLFKNRYPGIEFKIDLPTKEGQDWNDVLKEKIEFTVLINSGSKQKKEVMAKQ